jgi:hypothetical protein
VLSRRRGCQDDIYLAIDNAKYPEALRPQKNRDTIDNVSIVQIIELDDRMTNVRD